MRPAKTASMSLEALVTGGPGPGDWNRRHPAYCASNLTRYNSIILAQKIDWIVAIKTVF
jgi:hypothetical protein